MGKAIKLSNVDFSKTGLGTITFLLPLQSLAIIGESSVSGAGRYSVVYTPAATYERSVVWSIVSGSEYASIDQTGLVTAIEGASENSVTIRATSTTHASIYAEKTISVTYAAEILNVHKIFGGTSDDVIETNYKLFSDEMPNWTLLVCAPDATSTNQFQTAVHCMDESGAPYFGLCMQVTDNRTNRGIGVDMNFSNESKFKLDKLTRIITPQTTSLSRFKSGHTMPIGISRRGSDYYYTSDGEIWRLFTSYSANVAYELVIGAYRDANGDLGRYYNSNGEYLDLVLYSAPLVGNVTFFSEHGVNPAFYTLNNYTCDGTESTAINTELSLFDYTTYPNGVLLQAELTLPSDASIVAEQTLFGCKSYGESTANGVKLVNQSSGTMRYNITPAIANTDVSVTRGNRYTFGVRIKNQDWAVSFGSSSKQSTTDMTGHNWPLTIGGALSALPNTWYQDRFAAFTIHNLTIREL